MRRVEHSFNILMSEDEFEALTRLANNAGMSRGGLVRSLIRGRRQMEERGMRICANGQMCGYPQMYPPPPGQVQM